MCAETKSAKQCKLASERAKQTRQSGAQLPQQQHQWLLSLSLSLFHVEIGRRVLFEAFLATDVRAAHLVCPAWVIKVPINLLGAAVAT